MGMKLSEVYVAYSTCINNACDCIQTREEMMRDELSHNRRLKLLQQSTV